MTLLILLLIQLTQLLPALLQYGGFAKMVVLLVNGAWVIIIVPTVHRELLVLKPLMKHQVYGILLAALKVKYCPSHLPYCWLLFLSIFEKSKKKKKRVLFI
jgi:hypothetical protein